MPKTLVPDSIWLVTSTTYYGSWRGIVKGDKFGIPLDVLEKGIPALRKFLRDRRISAYRFRIDGIPRTFNAKFDLSSAKYIDVFGPHRGTSTLPGDELLLELRRPIADFEGM